MLTLKHASTGPGSHLALVRLTTLGFLLAGLLCLVLARAGTVQAAGTVTDCSSDVDLNAKLAGGGLVSFNCAGTAPIIITVTTPGGIVPASDTAIDGTNNGNPITLSGGGSTRLFNVQAGLALTLANISLTDGYASGGGTSDLGGAIFNHGGFLVLDHVTISNSRSIYAGGAIANVAGTTVVMDSLIAHNRSNYAGGIQNSDMSTVTLSNSTLFSNTADSYGGGIYNRGMLLLTTTTLSANRAIIDGGGIYNYFGVATLTNSTLSGNSALDGGGIFNDVGSAATLNNSTLSGNSAGKGGGGIFNYGTATLNTSTLSGNSATYGGGINNNDGTATLNTSTLSGNTASNLGGGIYNAPYGTVTLNNSTLSGNTASNLGGGIFNYGTATLNNSTLSGNTATYGGGIYTLGTATLTNTTISGNSATQGGGIYNDFKANLLNVTVSNNSATSGGALFMVSGKTIVLTNTILAYSAAGGNCSGTVSASTYSISSDNSCNLPGWPERPNPNVLDPLLTALGNYGGPTQVHMLKALSPAKDAVVGSNAPLFDQRGLPRPGPDGSFDIGAVERQDNDSDLAPRLYLPLLVR